MPCKARVCEQCDKLFQPKREDQRFCTTYCKNLFHNAQRAKVYKDGQKLREVPVGKVLWVGDTAAQQDHQLSWARREVIMEAFARNREALLKHLAETLGIERRLLLELERAFDLEKPRT